jgi:hypothetical protein
MQQRFKTIHRSIGRLLTARGETIIQEPLPEHLIELLRRLEKSEVDEKSAFPTADLNSSKAA